jgi:hypothetical protein
MVDPRVDPGAWAQHGALLTAVDRLRVEIDTAVHPSDVPWRPGPIAGRPRAAVRKALNAAAVQPSRVAAVSGRRARELATRLGRRRP